MKKKIVQNTELIANICDRHHEMRDLAQLQLVQVQRELVACNDVTAFWQQSETVALTRIITGCDQRLDVIEHDYAALLSQIEDLRKG